MNELAPVKWDEISTQIELASHQNDISTLNKYHAGLGNKEFRKQITGSIAAINSCVRYKIKIEFAFGDYYRGLENDNRNSDPLSSQLTRDTNKKQAQEEIGKSRETINKYTRMSNIKDRYEFLNQYETYCNERGREMSSDGFIRFTRDNQYNLITPEIPKGKFRIIYADPPWKYGNTMPGTGKGSFTEQADYYQLMTIEELCGMELPEIDDNTVLFLWVTSPILEESFKVINAWGFQYKSSFVWDKVKHNMGHYNSVRHEFLLVCTKGSCMPDVKKLYDSVQSIERTKHSEKPQEFKDIIDTIYPNGKRIQLFAREKYKGWENYGNQL